MRHTSMSSENFVTGRQDSKNPGRVDWSCSMIDYWLFWKSRSKKALSRGDTHQRSRTYRYKHVKIRLQILRYCVHRVSDLLWSLAPSAYF